MVDHPIGTDEKYQGPGPITSAFGDSAVKGFQGAGIGAAVGAIASPLAMRDTIVNKILAKATENFGEIGARLPENFTSKNVKISLFVAMLLGGASLGANIGSILGYFTGFNKANKGKEQFEAAKAQRDLATQKVAALQTQVEGLQSEVASTHKKFTDHITSRGEHGSYSEHTSSRAEHGSHLAATEAADKAAAAHHGHSAA